MLHSVKLDYLRAADLIETLLENLKEYRSDSKGEMYFQEPLELATKNKLKCYSSKKQRKATAPAKMDDYVILSKLGKCDTITDSTSMKIAILIPTIDVFLGELSRCFYQENMAIFPSLAALDPNSKRFLDFDTVQPLVAHYNPDQTHCDHGNTNHTWEMNGTIPQTIA